METKPWIRELSGKNNRKPRTCPLQFEPGKLIERINGNISLRDYMRKHTWHPLGIKGMASFSASGQISESDLRRCRCSIRQAVDLLSLQSKTSAILTRKMTLSAEVGYMIIPLCTSGSCTAS
jgi:hypothetical protein